MSDGQNNRKIVEIWQAAKPGLTTLCEYKLRSCPGEAEDIISEVFRAFMEEIHKRQMPGNPYGWMLQVAKNLIKQKYTEVNNNKQKLVKVDFENSQIVELQIMYDFTDEMISDEDIEVIKAGLMSELTASEQELIQLVCEDKLKMKEIAILLGSTETAVKQKYYRTCKKVKKLAREHIEKFL